MPGSMTRVIPRRRRVSLPELLARRARRDSRCLGIAACRSAPDRRGSSTTLGTRRTSRRVRPGGNRNWRRRSSRARRRPEFRGPTSNRSSADLRPPNPERSADRSGCARIPEQQPAVAVSIFGRCGAGSGYHRVGAEKDLRSILSTRSMRPRATVDQDPDWYARAPVDRRRPMRGGRGSLGGRHLLRTTTGAERVNGGRVALRSMTGSGTLDDVRSGGVQRYLKSVVRGPNRTRVAPDRAVDRTAAGADAVACTLVVPTARLPAKRAKRSLQTRGSGAADRRGPLIPTTARDRGDWMGPTSLTPTGHQTSSRASRSHRSGPFGRHRRCRRGRR